MISRLLAACLSMVLIWLTACNQSANDREVAPAEAARPTAATLGEQAVQSNAALLRAPQYQNANLKNGASQAQICEACHSLQSGGPNMIGPALYGFFGQAAGAAPGFQYSAAMQDADFIWTPRALDAWLAQPGSFLPGNAMTFAGVFRQSDRDDLIAYLLHETDDATEN